MVSAMVLMSNGVQTYVAMKDQMAKCMMVATVLLKSVVKAHQTVMMMVMIMVMEVLKNALKVLLLIVQVMAIAVLKVGLVMVSAMMLNKHLVATYLAMMVSLLIAEQEVLSLAMVKNL